MTNEEAFRKWRTDYESDYDKKPTYLEVWQAAISYMQEQSAPVAWVYAEDIKQLCRDFSSRNGNVYIKDVEACIDAMIIESPQRQQPLKRLSQLEVLQILNECTKSPYTNTQSALGFSNAIMEKMQELNK